MSHIYGTPVSTDFMQERQRSVLTSKMNNTKPWEEIRVGPGLNKGFSSEGTGGFNSGMESRSSSMPKTVDQFRGEAFKLDFRGKARKPAIKPQAHINIRHIDCGDQH